MTFSNEFPVRANVILFLRTFPSIEEEAALLDAVGGVRGGGGGVLSTEKGRKNYRRDYNPDPSS